MEILGLFMQRNKLLPDWYLRLDPLTGVSQVKPLRVGSEQMQSTGLSCCSNLLGYKYIWLFKGRKVPSNFLGLHLHI